MKTINLPSDVTVFGFEVKTFPLGVGEAFHKLINMIPEGANRSYYGISFMNGNKMAYYAMAEELTAGEAEKYSGERMVIESGMYLAETLQNWRSQTDCIKDIFGKIINDKRSDKAKPAVEWYKNEDEMLCMVKAVDQNVPA